VVTAHSIFFGALTPTVNGYNLTPPTQTPEQKYSDLTASNRRPSTPVVPQHSPKIFMREPVYAFSSLTIQA